MNVAAQKKVWVLTDERPGNRTQSMGVAQKLPYDFTEKNLQFTALAGLPNRVLSSSHYRLTKESREQLQAPWPDIAIAAGRRCAPLLRYIKRKNPDCFTVYLMNPQSPLKHFDLVAMPEHDSPPKRSNVLPTVGPVHGLNATLLQEAADNWRDKLSHLSTPRIAVLVGGDSKSASFTNEDFHEVGHLASQLARSMGEDVHNPASLMVTTSPRTNARGLDYLRLSLSVDHEFFIWQSRADNPYRAFLALSDVIIVTGDSMSMCAEACSVGKPVYIYLPRGGQISPKLQRFHKALFDRKLAEPLSAGVKPHAMAKNVLDEAARVADEIIKRNGTLI